MPPKYVTNYKSHVFGDHTKINQTKKLNCEICKLSFKSEEKIQSHFCETFRYVVDPIPYSYYPEGSELSDLVNDLTKTNSCLQIYTLCFNTKACIPSIFPPIETPREWHKYGMKDYGTTSGTFFVMNCLREKIQVYF